MDTVRIPVGMTVLSLAGKDKGRVYAVIGTAQGPYVYVADGRKYPKSDCKKKNCRHLRPLALVQIPTPVAMTCTYVNW